MHISLQSQETRKYFIYQKIAHIKVLLKTFIPTDILCFIDIE
jgi:hypothetical protein